MKTHFYSILALLFLFVSLSTAAQAQEKKSNQQLTEEVNHIQQNLGKLQKELAGVQRLLDNQALIELFQRLDDLSDEVSNLRGLVEQQGHDLDAIKKRQRELYLDVDRRLRELEIGSGTSGAGQKPIKLPDTASNPQQQPPGQPVQTATPAAPVVEPPSGPSVHLPPAKETAQATVSEERAAYQKAFDMLKEGRYKMANASFRNFLKRYPDSNYADNAQYWLGESNYVTRQFKQAVDEFRLVVQRYPASNKVPAALLKLGYTYYELQQFDAAKASLRQLIKKYPTTTEARLAQKRMERMKREGL